MKEIGLSLDIVYISNFLLPAAFRFVTAVALRLSFIEIFP